MFNENIHFDGKDSVGKGDAAKNAVAALLFSQEIRYQGMLYKPEDICVIQTDYPQYWGVGMLVHRMNTKHIGRKYLEQKGYSQDELLHMRKAMFAIDRLIALIIMYKIKKQPGKLYIHISDRGPYSQAITHAVCFTNETDYLKSLESITDSDECYMNRTRPNNVLLEAQKSGIGGAGGRRELDELEAPLYQQLADKGFNAMKQDKKHRITPVTTRIGKPFRPRSDIAREVLQTINVTAIGMPNFEALDHKDFLPKFRTKNLIQIGPMNLLGILFPSLSSDTHVALSGIEGFDIWRRRAYFSNEEVEGIAARTGNEKKEKVVKHEEINAGKISQLIAENDMAQVDVPEDILKMGRYLLGEYTGGQLLEFIEAMDHFYDEDGKKLDNYPSGYEKLIKHLFLSDVT